MTSFVKNNYLMMLLDESVVFDKIKLPLYKYDAKKLCDDFDVWVLIQN